MAPYTTVLPKPLMPLTDRPIIDVILRQLVGARVEAVVISVGHLGGLIESWIRNEGGYGVPISFLYESEPLGTAGALRVADAGDGVLLAMNGDILTTLRYEDLVNAHERTGAAATIAVKEREVPVEYGVVHTDGSGLLRALEEKPTLRYTVSMGVYVFEPSVIELIRPRERIDFPDLLLRMIDSGQAVSIYRHEGYWRDIGKRDDYEVAVSDFGADPARFLDTGR